MMKSSTAFRNSFKCIAFALYMQAGKVRLKFNTILLLSTPKLGRMMVLQMLDSFPGSPKPGECLGTRLCKCLELSLSNACY